MSKILPSSKPQFLDYWGQLFKLKQECSLLHTINHSTDDLLLFSYNYAIYYKTISFFYSAVGRLIG